tara:strand:- start:615 stop:1451 length:837 start_codon:yes stop_codon:yes gene_type:complete
MSKEIIQSLLPNIQYNFITVSGASAKSVYPHVYLEMFSDDDELRQVTMVENSQEFPIWYSNGIANWGSWNEDAYSKIVFEILDLLDKDLDAYNSTGEDFITQAIKDGLHPIDAVNSWLSDAYTGTKVTVSRHIKDMLDIDFEISDGELPTVLRVVIDQNPKKGDVFNVYYGEGSKGGASFDTCVLTSVRNYFREIAKEKAPRPDDAYLDIYKQAQEVAQRILSLNGYDGDSKAISSAHNNIRIRNAFDTACEIMQMLQGHEMSDIVEDVEAYLSHISQ